MPDGVGTPSGAFMCRGSINGKPVGEHGSLQGIRSLCENVMDNHEGFISLHEIVGEIKGTFQQTDLEGGKEFFQYSS